MALDTRYHALENRGFRDHVSSVWDHVKNMVGFFGSAAFLGLTIYNLYIIGGWISDHYASKRAERHRVIWKRRHPKDWNIEGYAVEIAS